MRPVSVYQTADGKGPSGSVATFASHSCVFLVLTIQLQSLKHTSLMSLGRLQSALSSKHVPTTYPQHSLPDATSLNMRMHSSRSWNSTHQDFTRLRFFVWTGGDPGFTLTTATQSERHFVVFEENAELVVDRVTALKVWEAGIRPGDILETVSNKRVHTMDPEAALVLVKLAKCPSIIRFRSSSSGTRARFDVLLGRQKLGVYFTGDGIRDIPIVTRLGYRARLHGFNRDTASTCGARLGDVLLAVDGRDAVAAGLSMTMKYLETCPRPVKLTFGRLISDDYTNGCCKTLGEHQRRSSYQHDTIAINGMPAKKSASYRSKRCLSARTPKSIHLVSSPLQEKVSSHAIYTEIGDSVVVNWKSGPLGLTLHEDALSGAPVVNRLTGKGSSANMERLQHGFLLHSVNGSKTEGRLLDDVYHDLLTLPKPLKLVFCPAQSDGISEPDSESRRKLSSLSSSSSITPTNSTKSEEVELNKSDRRAFGTARVSQGRYSQQVRTIHEQYEYEVVWTSTRLGLQLEIAHIPKYQPAKKDKTNRMPNRPQYPIIRKILKESTLGLPSDAVGHFFVSINNWHTSGLSVEELRTLLRAASKPALLRFRRQDYLPGPHRTLISHPVYAATEKRFTDREATLGSAYSILWSEGKLGIVFGCYEDAACHDSLVVYVKSIGPGQAQNSIVAVGDILCSVNGRKLPPKHNFKKTIGSMVNTLQPVTLGFRRLLMER